MSSIRNLTAALALGLVCLGVGCVKKQPTPPPTANNQQLPTDEAMAKRDWNESRAKYTNTATPAGPDRFPYQPSNPDNGRWLDTPLFLVNTVVWPFTYIDNGINDLVDNQSGASIGPGYTAAPPADPRSGGLAWDYNGRTQRSQVEPPNAPGSVGGSNTASPNRAAGGLNNQTGSGTAGSGGAGAGGR